MNRRIYPVTTVGSDLLPETVFRGFIDGLCDAVIVLNAEGVILEVNRAAEALYGHARRVMIGQHPLDLCRPGAIDSDRFQSSLGEAWDGDPQQFETDGVRADGTLFPKELNLSAGDCWGRRVLLLQARDISRRKSAQSSLEQSEGRFRLLFQRVPTLAVQGFDENGIVHFWNAASERLYGFTSEQAIGQSICDLIVPPIARARHEFVIREMVEKGEAGAPAEALMMRKDGARVSVFSSHTLLRLPGQKAEIYQLDLDLTERKRAEKALHHAKEAAEAANRAKSSFLAVMSHEIRTPLYAVIGMASQLVQTELTEAQQDMVRTISNGGEGLLGLVNDVLDFSKIEANKVELKREPFDLSKSVTDALDIFATQCADKRVELTYFIDANAPATLVGDRQRLRQVLLNLLSNAVKFTDRGEIQLTVEANPVENGYWNLSFALTDSGIGIPDKLLLNLFEPFSQADSSMTRKYGGSGLGLAITRRLVQLMGGDITVASSEGEGSCFQFNIRVAMPPDAGRIYVYGKNRLLEGRKVLIIDSNPNNRRLMAAMMRSWGMSPMLVESVHEAVSDPVYYRSVEAVVVNDRNARLEGPAIQTQLKERTGKQCLPLVYLSPFRRAESEEGLEDLFRELVLPVRPESFRQTFVNLFEGKWDQAAGSAAQVVNAPVEKTVLKVLLAEDNKVNQKVTLMMLRNLGHEGTVVENGMEAVEAVERDPYDLILMDRQMPVMDGLDATRQICRRYPETSKRPRIIALTADAMEEDRERFLQAGADAYLSKPIRTKDLGACINEVFGFGNS